ncbi:MAG: DUF308 domain-containing protein [Coriobacteriia bacterium]|nr:DUF308 domain-containing protein [Coriobacteriia bacterium]
MSAYHEGDTRADGWAIAAGVVLVIVGILAIGAPLVAAATAALVLPIALFVKGASELVSLTRAPSTGAITWRLIVGVLSILAGFLLLFQPVAAIVTLPIVLIAYLLVTGLVKLVVSFVPGVDGRVWVGVSGVISIILGILLLTQPFVTTLVLIGIFIGIDVLFVGVALIAAGLQARHGYPPGVRAI